MATELNVKTAGNVFRDTTVYLSYFLFRGKTIKTSIIMEDFESLIDKVISGELQNVNSGGVLISPETVNKYLKEQGLEQVNFDSNGWDWDFWMEYYKGDKKFTLAGSGWYNNGLSFYSEDK